MSGGAVILPAGERAVKHLEYRLVALLIPCYFLLEKRRFSSPLFARDA